jgi:hypothetical protein
MRFRQTLTQVMRLGHTITVWSLKTKLVSWKRPVSSNTKKFELTRDGGKVLGTLLDKHGITLLKFTLCGNSATYKKNFNISEGINFTQVPGYAPKINLSAS